MDNEHFEPVPVEGMEESINLRHYWHVILERRWLVITTFVAVFALSLIYLFKATPIYEATARIEIDQQSENILNLQDGLTVGANDQDYLVTQYKNLKSRSLIASVIDQLHLDKDPRYTNALDVVAAVSSDITVDPIRLSRLVEVKADHPNPLVAEEMANTLATNFLEEDLDQKKAKTENLLKWLKDEASSLEAQVTNAEWKVQQYRESNRMVSLVEDENIILQSLKQAQLNLDNARSKSTAAQRDVDEINRLLAKGQDLVTIPEVAQDDTIKTLTSQLAVMEVQLDGLKTKYGPLWPEVIETSQKVADLNSQIQSEAKKVLQTIKNQAQLAKAQEDSAQNTLQSMEQKALDLSRARITFDLLDRQAEKNKTLYSTVIQKMKELDLTSKNLLPNMRIVDAATQPLRPVKPRIALTLVLGVMAGMGLGVGLAFFVNYLDDSIKSQDDVETYLRLAFLGYVPNIKTNSVVERDLQAHLHPQSSAAESFRTVRATVALSRRSEQFRVLTITSTGPSEGKSLVASNLAIVTAQTGVKTLLVDADLRRPSVHKAFQLQSPVGLSAYLNEKVQNLDEFVHSTEVPNLDVVCCGAMPDQPAELLGSKRMLQFLQEARKRYDRVFLDCPPISAVSDPLVAAAMTDGVIFVTKFNKVRREHAQKSIQRLQDAGIHVLGLVLNDIDFEGKDSYYYSYYYYQNRYYDSHYRTDSDKELPGSRV